MKIMKRFSRLFFILAAVAIVIGLVAVYNHFSQERLLKQIIERLTADTRIAHVLVTQVKTDTQAQKLLTTIKFVELDTRGNPLPAKYFTFSGNVIQFQSLVVRFDDFLVKKADPLKGKSAYIFLKAFSLDGDKAESYDINKSYEIPGGYQVSGGKNCFENRLWKRFWDYALDPQQASRSGIKNVQIEAPGTKFVPGIIYTIKIEHDGGMRIDTQSLPGILKGEKLEF
jgi:hypothetical protein